MTPLYYKRWWFEQEATTWSNARGEWPKGSIMEPIRVMPVDPFD